MHIFWPTDDGLGGRVAGKKNIFGKTEKPEFDHQVVNISGQDFAQKYYQLTRIRWPEDMVADRIGSGRRIFFSYFPL